MKAAFWFIIIAALSCTSKANLLGNGVKNALKEDGEVVQAQPEGQKDTDQSEGVPGYLVNPEAIAVQTVPSGDLTTLQLEAPANSVKPGTEVLENLVVEIFQPNAIQSRSPESIALRGVSLGRVSISASGAFTAAATVNPRLPVLLVVKPNGVSDGEELTLPANANLYAGIIDLPAADLVVRPLVIADFPDLESTTSTTDPATTPPEATLSTLPANLVWVASQRNATRPNFSVVVGTYEGEFAFLCRQKVGEDTLVGVFRSTTNCFLNQGNTTLTPDTFEVMISNTNAINLTEVDGENGQVPANALVFGIRGGKRIYLCTAIVGSTRHPGQLEEGTTQCAYRITGSALEMTSTYKVTVPAP